MFILFILLCIVIVILGNTWGSNTNFSDTKKKQPTTEDKMQPDFHSDNPEDYL